MATVADRYRAPQALCRAGLLAFALALSPDVPAADGWVFTPSVSLRGTATDNVDLSDTDKHGDFITEVIPAITVDGQGARVKLHLDYRMDNLIYARDSSKNNLQNTLNAIGSVEAIENFFYVDGVASIAQGAVSPFGPRPTDATTFTDNRTETRTYRLSPYIRGRLASSADYLLRYSYTDLRSSSDATGDSRVGALTAQLGDTTSSSTLGWRIDANSQTVDSDQRRDTRADRARGSLVFAIDPQFRLTGTAGYERNDYQTFGMSGQTTFGGGFEWAPSARSNVHGNWERRFFGSGWDFGARNRTPFLAFSITATRDVQTDAQNAAGINSGAAYDLLFAALTTRFPDALDRAAEAQRILQGGDIPPNLGLPPDFLVGGVYVERRQQASAAFLGVRNTLTFIVYQVNRQPLGVGESSATTPGFASSTREKGASATFSHRLSGFSSVTAITSWRRTTGESSTSELSSRQWDARLLYVTQFGRRTSGSLEYRHARFNSDAGGSSDYRENALIGSLLYQF